MNAESMLELVRASPLHVGRHDRAAWRALFAEGARVEDPVGTPPCVKTGPGDDLDRFWNTFIGPNGVAFDPKLDLVGRSCVARRVDIETSMSTGLKMVVPAYLLYEIVETEEGLKIDRLAAHWESSRASKSIMAEGLRGTASVLLSSFRILRHLGLKKGRAYIDGTQRGVRRRGKEAVLAFIRGVHEGELDGVEVELDDRPIELEELGALTLHPNDLVASGRSVACHLANLVDRGDGLGFFDFDERGELKRARLYGAYHRAIAR